MTRTQQKIPPIRIPRALIEPPAPSDAQDVEVEHQAPNPVPDSDSPISAAGLPSGQDPVSDPPTSDYGIFSSQKLTGRQTDSITLEHLHQQLMDLQQQLKRTDPTKPITIASNSVNQLSSSNESTAPITLESIHRELQVLQKHEAAAGKSSRIPDLPRPQAFNGDASMFRGWSAQVENYL